jgi:hypothetical protein
MLTSLVTKYGGHVMPVVRISEELFKEIQKYAEPLVDNFETALWKALRKNEISLTISPRKEKIRAVAELTPPSDYWIPILKSILESGEKASRQEVHNHVESRMKDKFKPGDFEVNRDGTLKWNKQVDYQRLAMVHNGLIRKDSPVGIWEITEIGKRWLQNHS